MLLIKLLSFDKNEVKSIENQHHLFHSKKLKIKLDAITHFQCLIETVTRLGKSNVTLI